MKKNLLPLSLLFVLLPSTSLAQSIKLAAPKSTNHDLPILKSIYGPNAKIEAFEVPFDKINKPEILMENFDVIGTYAITDRDLVSDSPLKGKVSSVILTWSNKIISTKKNFASISELKGQRVYAFSGITHVT